MKNENIPIKVKKQNPEFDPKKPEIIYKLVSEKTKDMISLHSLHNFSYLCANRAYYTITGYSENEILGKNALDFVHPDDKNYISSKIKEFMQNKTACAEFRFLKKDGDYIWVEATAELAHIEHKNPLILAITRDITQRKQTEEVLKLSEKQYRAVVEDQSELICRFLPDGKLTFVNEAYCRYFKKNKEELIGNSFMPFIPEEDHEKVEKYLASLSPENPVVTYEHRVITPEGDIRWQQWTDRALFDENGVIVEFQSVGCDITRLKLAEEKLLEAHEKLENRVKEQTSKILKTNEILRAEISRRRQIEKELREGKAQYKALADSIKDIFFAIDKNFRLTYWNKTSEIFSGISSYKALGKNLYKILPDIRGTKADQVFLEVMKTRKSQTFIHEYQYKKKNYIFEVSVYPAENGISIFARDITRYKLMEKEIARLDRLDLAGKIAASISHEIRNPLTTVKGFLQILRNQDKYEQEKEFFDLMIEELERSNLIISEFLRLAKNKSIELSEQNLNTIIQNLYPLMDANARISDKQILLELEDIPDLLLDKKEICQLIVNLVRNGLEAMSPGQNLTIKTFLDKKAEEVVLAIRDEGCGIDPEILDKIGTPFLTTKEEGTGLGLPVCYSIAARHNADIKIETGQNGTTFFIRFKNPIMTLF